MSFAHKLAEFIGETVRIRRTRKNAMKIAPQKKQIIDNLKRDAESGDISAMWKLATLYYNGDEIEYDPSMVCYWLTEAAERGHVSAQYDLGLLYKGDLSTYFYDEDKAGYWFSIASQNGDEEAKKMLQDSFAYNDRLKRWYIK